MKVNILFGLGCSCLADRDRGASALGETKGYANPYLLVAYSQIFLHHM